MDFWVAIVKTVQMIYNLTGFSDVRIFHFFGNDIIMTSCLVTWSSNLHILWNLPRAISLQSLTYVDCLGKVLWRDYKNTMMSLWRHCILLGFKISIFCKTGYKLSTCQVSDSSVIWIKFYWGFIRHPKIPWWRQYGVTSQYLLFKIAHFVEINRRCQSACEISLA